MDWIGIVLRLSVLLVVNHLQKLRDVATHKVRLLLLLAVASNSAAAAWVEVSDDEADTFYADPATIRKAGNMVKMWTLIDFKTVQVIGKGKSYLSMRRKAEYDCKEEQARTVYLSWHPGNMSGGDAVHSDADPGKWRPVPPGSVTEILWKIACGKQ
jgi:hypothetical protein